MCTVLDEHNSIATKRARNTGRMATPLSIINNGEERLDYLFHRSVYSASASSPHPGILRPDLNKPRIDGLLTIRTINRFWKLVELPGEHHEKI